MWWNAIAAGSGWDQATVRTITFPKARSTPTAINSAKKPTQCLVLWSPWVTGGH